MKSYIRARDKKNFREVVASFRVTEKEYEAIKKQYGGMAGLRDVILKELGAMRDVEKEKVKLGKKHGN